MGIPRPLFFPSLPPLEDPIRAELFGVERLEQHAASLAAAQPVASGQAPQYALLPRVNENGRVLREAQRSVAKVVGDEQWITPAAEWLVDNFFVVEEQLREIRDKLPVGYYRELPALADGPLVGYPRVYGIAWAFVAHTDSRFDPDTLRRFVQAYQRVQPLTIGELWAVTISLRVVLVENLRRLADAIVGGRVVRQAADSLADEVLGLRDHNVESVAAVMSRDDNPRLVTAFAVELVQRLRDQDPAVTPALAWLQQRLAAQGTTADEIAMLEHRRQAAMTVTVRNIITSMRLISALDWTLFFESVSLVDEVLRDGSNFATMDFASRDSYRHAIEALARGSGQTELAIATAALAQSHRSAAVTAGLDDLRESDPGFHLIGGGRRDFERVVGYHPTLTLRVQRALLDAATLGYLGTLFLCTVAILAALLVLAHADGVVASRVVVVGLFALIPASDLAVALLNRFVAAVVVPHRLPRLEWRDGVPAEFRTMVAVPTLLTGVADVEEQIERLEVHYLANADGDVRFALVSDWLDAPTEHAAGDLESLAAVQEGIARLNVRHGPAPGGGARFHVYHRRRRWNANERTWMGWERKRGKLHELNRFLRGAADTSFLPAAEPAPDAVRYIVTLDADTRLPIGTIHRLVGTMAHSLNRPRLDPATRRVIDGYAVLQPRVTAPLPGAGSSVFERLCSGDLGIDPYVGAVSDVYQDLFCTGSYTGKGIYDIDAFEAALAGRVPENTLLSHDLFEGIFARAGLVTDVELFEDVPASYLTAAGRQHRWARGDWQLLPWIMGAQVSLIDRWKMLDNLRRTMSMPAACITLVLGWTWPGSAPLLWTAFILIVVVVPTLVPALAAFIGRVPDVSRRSQLRTLTRDLRASAGQAAFTLTTMADQAWLMAHAIALTVSRLVTSRGRLLEWKSTAHAARNAPRTIAGFYRCMAGGILVTVIAAVLIGARRIDGWIVAAPILALWGVAPVVARWMSQARPVGPATHLSSGEALALRLIARRTWEYFTTFVTAESSFLPPDNFQETPHPVIAERTSPTNIGLYLLAAVSAHDFGWSGTLDTIDRIEATLDSMRRLEHHRGHLYNWYDTRHGHPLEPKYVSTVDSGNLAGALLTLSRACQEMLDRPQSGDAALSGIRDAALLLRAVAHAAPERRTTRLTGLRRFDDAIDVVMISVAEQQLTGVGWARKLGELDAAARTVAHHARDIDDHERAGSQPALLPGANALRAAVATHARDIDTLLPWSRLRIDDAAIAVMAQLTPAPVLADLPARSEAAQRDLAKLRAGLLAAGVVPLARLQSLDALAASLERSATAGALLRDRLERLAGDARKMVTAMEFGFLLDSTRMLLAIGYRLEDGTLDPGRYDLLASEARLASFLAIAKGDIPARHWFRLGRLLAPAGNDAVLLSWSGSMFEYLMPHLVMQAPFGSLLEQTSRLAVQRQIDYAMKRGVPWGISESAYYARDVGMAFQYSSFGVPGLGLRRGLSDDVVIAPYATALAAMVLPAAAARNFRTLAAAGADGRYGFYESLDYTPARLPADTSCEAVRTYMAHHQAMTIIAMDNVLNDGIMCSRFHAAPIVRASELLLQERTPRAAAISRSSVDMAPTTTNVRELVPPRTRHFSTPHGATPRTQLLSNGRYTVMLTTAGSGYSRWRDLAVTRWREDATCDDTGSFIYVRDAASGECWSAGFQPTGAVPDSYDVSFAEDHAEFLRRDGTLATQLDVIVSSEDDAEVRRVSLTNHGSRTREIDVTSYLEIVLAPAAADLSHPAFSNLFVQTEIVPERSAIVATRRQRSPDDAEIWLAHVLAVEGETIGDLQWETDRAQFLGRGQRVRTPQAETAGQPLSNTTGSVLDPIVSLRRRVRIRPGKTVRVAFSTVVAPSRAAVLVLADKYHDITTFERVATLAWTQAQVELHHLGIGPDEAHLFQALGGAVLFSDRALRGAANVLARRTEATSALWAMGISGDLPIVVVEIDDPDDIGIVRQLLRAHAYWRMKRLAVDLVILNDRAPSYVQDLQTLIETLVRSSQAMSSAEGSPAAGRVFTLRLDRITGANRDLLMSVARVDLSSRRGTLAEQMSRAHCADGIPGPAPRTSVGHAMTRAEVSASHASLEFPNGFGGFGADGREYVITLRPGQWTPAPWINVIANPNFGCLVSEAGAGCTWSVNSQENLLTPWSNDPVSDPPSEMLYVHDAESGELWTPTPLPIREVDGEYVVRHGHGYTHFARDAHGVALELLQFVPVADPIKVSRLTLTNHSGGARKLSVTLYLEWVLGTTRSTSAPSVITDIDSATGAMFARNCSNQDFCNRIAFADLGGAQTAWTGDRTEFLGRNGALDHPAAFRRGQRLSGRSGTGLDPCCALQAEVEIPAGGQVSVVCFLGQTETRDQAQALIKRYRAEDLDRCLQEVTGGWADVLGAVVVNTPDRALDLMLNQWLLYQTLACRLWARTAFYQASGAFGFRDQLQDVMALAVSRPDLTRAQILKAASRQFVEGDVQHWWHEPAGRGVRTRISDDLLWLPYVTSHYVEVTEDGALLDEPVSFLDGAVLAPGQAESYFEPGIASERGTLFEHCARALDRSLRVGAHGLPLMGTGDWNDGMNRVGAGGKGESVWLAWFLHAVLTAWAPIAAARGDNTRAVAWAGHATMIKEAIEHEAWDGAWYRRAYFDDGTPLGTAGSDACAIDSIAQSWGVMSGAAAPQRAQRAMAAVNNQLVKRNDRLVLLLTPPFDHTALEPGYIKGYVPGVRENGGQYTHAAAWTAIAFAMLGDGDKAAELIAMLNPINHAATPNDVERYRVEPYVAVGDIYSEAPHVGRGGWTWYSGSAGWLYRAGIEWLLGIRLRGARLLIDPCIPAAWPGFTASVRYRSARYDVTVENPDGLCHGVALLEVDDLVLHDSTGVPLVDDQRIHHVRVVLGAKVPAILTTIP